MNQHNTRRTIWLKAAVVGSLWASMEIVVGSFLHNIHAPFSGTLLGFFSLSLLIAFHHKWQDKGLILRAGIIAALMRSISPTAIIIGPMAGIFIEGVLLEYSLRLFGKNKTGYFTGAFLSLSSNLMQKIVVILVFYGFNIVIVVENMARYAVKQLHINGIRAGWLIGILIMIYMLFAFLAVFIGSKAARVKQITSSPWKFGYDYSEKTTLFVGNTRRKQRFALLLLHFLIIVSGLVIISAAPYYIAFPAVAIYVWVVRHYYPQAFKRIARPKFWLQLLVIVLFASMFFNRFTSKAIFDIDGILTGLRMSFRAVLMVTAFTAISYELRNPVIKAVLYKRGFSQLYVSLGVAFGVLPSLLSQIAHPKNLLQNPVKQIAQLLHFSDRLLASFQKEVAEQQKIILISGLKRQGKSTFLKRVIEVLKTEHLKIDGIVAEGIDKNGKREGFDLVRVKDRHRYKLATLEPGKNREKTGRFYFDMPVFKSLSQQITQTGADVLVLDEIGHLELQEKGWASLVTWGFNRGIPMIWVVRKTLLENVMEHWHIPQAQVFDIEKYTPEKVANALLKVLPKR